VAKALAVSLEQARALANINRSSANYIIGIDEVGLGPWAGPVTVGAVVMPKGWSHEEVRDSKKLSHKGRLRARTIILKTCLAHCTLDCTARDIDRYGIKKAHALLTEGAALYCLRRFPDALIVQDGDIPVAIDGRPYQYSMVWLSKADVLVPAVSAASVLAKLHRDARMVELSRRYPHYDFEHNKGYHSLKHVEGLEHHGICSIHRRSYKPVMRYL